ncbi:oxidoreductase [Pigmentiphaga litoralis]|uniref:SDR family NAD(P)-dependent oxidoreductase n=1 Tax=Pigmentiphaga litoralis TaxID=516702 RepID=UPI001675CEC3|nr:SDR family oxidoreductase [Pigmentiphaga litoralis]GGX19750.1 oxidoreductase [Pigmentiphaga litoralis]
MSFFENKIALVTGGSSGIGFGIARHLADQGARVIITGRDIAKLDKAVQALGPNASGRVVDFTKTQDIDTLYQTVQRDAGRLDLVVANAGAGTILSLGKITEQQVDQTLGANVKGVIFTVQGALPLMASGGAIVIIGSTASFNPPAGMSVYGASKAAVRALVRAWIQEIKGSGVRINVVSPGPVRTEGLDNFFPPDQADAAFASLAEQSTVGRIGVPQDIAHTVAFLASDAAAYINGVELFVDGGASQI